MTKSIFSSFLRQSYRNLYCLKRFSLCILVNKLYQVLGKILRIIILFSGFDEPIFDYIIIILNEPISGNLTDNINSIWELTFPSRFRRC
ncbi:unnamed protein product [Rhizophagus irregularis]|nr:unnamed protein product [Rhizophagus irregularis]